MELSGILTVQALSLLIMDILNLDKFVPQRQGTPCKISLNLSVLLSFTIAI